MPGFGLSNRLCLQLNCPRSMMHPHRRHRSGPASFFLSLFFRTRWRLIAFSEGRSGIFHIICMLYNLIIFLFSLFLMGGGETRRDGGNLLLRAHEYLSCRRILTLRLTELLRNWKMSLILYGESGLVIKWLEGALDAGDGVKVFFS